MDAAMGRCVVISNINQISKDFVYIPHLILPASLYMAGEACGKQLKGTVWGAGYRWSLSQDNHLR